jgi:hypothetical protein
VPRSPAQDGGVHVSLVRQFPLVSCLRVTDEGTPWSLFMKLNGRV